MSLNYDLVRRLRGAKTDSLPPAFEAVSGNENASGLNEVKLEEVRIEPAGRIVLCTEPSGPGADRFRHLRWHLGELQKHKRLRSVLITSALPQDGKSTITLNLATALAESKKQSVLVIEGDLQCSGLSRHLGLDPSPGLAACLESRLNPFAAVRRLEPLGWYVLPAGRTDKNVAQLLQSEALAVTMQTLSVCFDWVLVDSPPVTPLTDALVFQKHVDATLLVVRAGITPLTHVENAIALLGREHVLGVLLNGVEDVERLYSKYYSQYGRR